MNFCFAKPISWKKWNKNLCFFQKPPSVLFVLSSTNIQLEKNQVRWSGVTLKDFKNERNIVIIVINSDSKVSWKISSAFSGILHICTFLSDLEFWRKRGNRNEVNGKTERKNL